MSDNLRQYRAIRAALIQGYPGEPTGRLVRHLTTLAAFISGIVASKSTQLPHIAMQVPDGQKPESRVKRFARWLDNARILEEMYFLPYAEILNELPRSKLRGIKPPLAYSYGPPVWRGRAGVSCVCSACEP